MILLNRLKEGLIWIYTSYTHSGIKRVLQGRTHCGLHFGRTRWVYGILQGVEDNTA